MVKATVGNGSPLSGCSPLVAFSHASWASGKMWINPAARKTPPAKLFASEMRVLFFLNPGDRKGKYAKKKVAPKMTKAIRLFSVT